MTRAITKIPKKKKAKMKVYTVREDLYGGEVDFVYGVPWTDVLKHFDIPVKNADEAANGKTVQLQSVKEPGFRKMIVWVNDKRDVDTLVHECVHLASIILHDKGVKLDPENDEPLAYYVAFWFRKLDSLMR